jgi:hypothetical protein
MSWYSYIACLLAGAFLANALPHFIKGITGEPFPTPFAKPPGKGLSSPLVNVLWGFLNLMIGLIFVHVSHLNHHHHPAIIFFLAGILLMSLQLASWFGKQHSR